MENWRKYIVENELKEATDDEISVIEDAMALSPLALPFNDLFGSKKRKLQVVGNDQIYEIDSVLKMLFKEVRFKKEEKKIEGGRKIIDRYPVVDLGSAVLLSDGENFKQKLKAHYKNRNSADSSKYPLPQDEPRPEFKLETMSLEKYLEELVKIKKNLPKMRNTVDNLPLGQPWGAIDNKLISQANHLIKYLYPITGRGGDSLFYDKFVAHKGEIIALMSKLVSAAIASPALDQIEKIQQSFRAVKRELVKPDSAWDPVKESYLIMSRDPIDVFRMSDHQGLGSCHTPPSSRDDLHPSMDAIWDEYNICAAAEAHGNGAVVYSIDKKQFEEKFGPLTQETLDNLNDQEIFTDSSRGVDGIEPTGRVRLRKVRFEDIEFAAIERKIYSKFPVGSRDKLLQILADEQSGKFETLKKTYGSKIDLKKGERYGGKYEDNKTDELFLEMAKKFGITGSGEFKYSADFQNSLHERFHPEFVLISKLRDGEHNSKDIDREIEFSVNEYDVGEYTISCKITFDFKIEVPEIINVINSGHSDFEDIDDFVDQQVAEYNTDWWDIAFKFSSLDNYVGASSAEIDADFDTTTDTVDIDFSFTLYDHDFDSIERFVDVCENLYAEHSDIEGAWEDFEEIKYFIKDYVAGDISSANNETLESFEELADQCNITVGADEGEIILNKRIEFGLEDDIYERFQDIFLNSSRGVNDWRFAYYNMRDLFKNQYVKKTVEKVWNEYEKQLKLPFGDIEKIDLGDLKEYIFKSFTYFINIDSIFAENSQNNIRIDFTFEFDYSSKQGSLPVMFNFMKMICRMQEDLQNYFSRDLSYKLRGDADSINENKQRSIKIKILRGNR